MNLVFSPRAVERMQQRNITPSDIEEIIFRHDGKIKQSHDKMIYYKRLKSRRDNQLAAVVIEKRNNLLEVLTVMVNFEVKR